MRSTLLSLTLVLTPVATSLGNPEQGEAPGKAPAAEEKAAEKAPGFLGVSAGEVPAALAEQLKLDHGVKLLTVNPDSPAGKAGLEVDDILTAVDEKKVSTMLELRDAIMGHKEGDEVTLKVVQKGKVVEKKVTLAGRPALPQMVVPRAGVQVLPRAGLGARNLQWNFGNGVGRFKIGDQDGSVEMSGEGEGREVRVWNLSNRVVYEGPWVTPQDKAAPSPKMRKRIERVEKMFVARGQQFQRRLEFPRPAPPPPAPQRKLPIEEAPKEKPEEPAEENAPEEQAPEE